MNTDFANYLKNERLKRGMTIRQLELMSGVSNAYISQVENCKRETPTPKIIKQLAGALQSDYTRMMVAAGYLSEMTLFTIEEPESNYNLDLLQKYQEYIIQTNQVNDFIKFCLKEVQQ